MSERILILGASGRTGKELCRQALQHGWQVNALVRQPARFSFSHPQLQIVEGTPADEHALNEAMLNCRAIVSALNISRTSDFPWSPLRTPRDFLSATMERILRIAPQHSINRILFTSAWGVAETRRDIPGWFRWFIEHSNIGVAYKDHERQEQLAAASPMEWTAVRPVGLLNGKGGKRVHVALDNSVRPRITIHRSDLAAFMLDALEKDLYIRQKPVVWS
jgi:uncharacterized protein YbjT (DUF2867 family)